LVKDLKGVVLKYYRGKLMNMLAGLIWLRTWSHDGILCMWWWTCGSRRNRALHMWRRTQTEDWKLCQAKSYSP